MSLRYIRAGKRALAELGLASLVASTVLFLAATMARAGQDAESANASEPADAVAVFEQAYDRFREFRIELLSRIRDSQSLTSFERGEIFREASIRSDELLQETITAAETALAANPNNAQVRRFLLLIVKKSYEADRFELSARLGRLLLDHGSSNTGLLAVVAHSLLESGKIDDAKEYYLAADKANVLDQKGKAYLEHIDVYKATYEVEQQLRKKDAEKGDLPRVLLRTTRGDVILELFEDEALNVVANFVHLVDEGFYDGLEFYRVMRGYGAVAGCPNNDGTGDPGHHLLHQSGASRGHFRGTVSMIPDRNNRIGSRFLISFRMTGNSRFNGKYPVFGRVVEGLDVVMRFNDTNPDIDRGGIEPDRILHAEVIRRRNHPYRPTTIAMLTNQAVENARQSLAQQDFDAAIEQLHAAVTIDPTHVDANKTLGVLYARKTDDESIDRAQYFLNKAATLAPSDVDVRFYLGTVLMRVSKFAAAAKQFAFVVQEDPAHYQAMNNLGIARSQQGRLEQAVECFEQALSIKPDYGAARDNLVRVQAQLDRER